MTQYISTSCALHAKAKRLSELLDLSVAEALQIVTHIVTEAERHGQTPEEYIVEELRMLAC